MENIEYVRVRKGDPQARFQAEHAERWEERQVMELSSFSFEQFEDSGETINSEGRAGAAVVQLGSGDVSLKGGVRIRVESEDITIRTAGLDWKDKDRILEGGPNDEVDIQRSDGTSFYGRGFTADARNRRWSFTGEVKGTYIEKEDEEENEEEETIIAAGAEWRGRPETQDVEKAAGPLIPGMAEEQAIEAKPAISEDEPVPPPVPVAPEPEQFFEPRPVLPVAEETILPEDK